MSFGDTFFGGGIELCANSNSFNEIKIRTTISSIASNELKFNK